MAHVRLNGKDIGPIWCAPWRIELGEGLKAKGNEIEIDVTNNWVNQLLFDSKLPKEKRGTYARISPNLNSAKPQASGLIGPVRLEGREESGR